MIHSICIETKSPLTKDESIKFLNEMRFFLTRNTKFKNISDQPTTGGTGKKFIKIYTLDEKHTN